MEKEFYALADGEGISDIADLNAIRDRAVNVRAFLKSNQRVDEVARFVAQHFVENVEPLGYKAFLVGVDREACALYKQALDKYLPPEYSVPVYTSGAADSIDYPLVAQYQVDPAQEKSIRKQFRKADRRSEEHTSELKSQMRTSYAVLCLKNKNKITRTLRLIMYKNRIDHKKTRTKENSRATRTQKRSIQTHKTEAKKSTRNMTEQHNAT